MNRFILILFLCLPVIGFTQQLPTQSLNQYDIGLTNPGYSAVIESTEISLHNRSQWVGFNEAPSTQTISFSKSISDKNIGYGSFVFNDTYGPFRKTGANVSGSYKLKISDDLNVGLGLSTSVFQFYVAQNRINLYHEDDQLVNNTISSNVWSIDYSFGAFVKHIKYYIGFSIINLAANNVKPFKSSSLEGNLKNVQHYYFTGGYDFEVNAEFTLTPNFFMDYTLNNPFHVQGGVTTDYKKFLEFGAAYSLNDAIIVLTKIKHENWFIAYSYDIVTSNLRTSTSGSHEIMLGYTFSNKKKANKASKY